MTDQPVKVRSLIFNTILHRVTVVRKNIWKMNFFQGGEFCYWSGIFIKDTKNREFQNMWHLSYAKSFNMQYDEQK